LDPTKFYCFKITAINQYGKQTANLPVFVAPMSQADGTGGGRSCGCNPSLVVNTPGSVKLNAISSQEKTSNITLSFENSF